MRRLWICIKQEAEEVKGWGSDERWQVDESNEFAGQLLPYTEENFLPPCCT